MVKTATVGQVFLIEDPDLIIDPAITGFMAIDWVQAYKDFRLTWGDDYDFVSMYVDLPSNMPILNDHQHTVYNAVEGINHPCGDNYDERKDWETSRLLGIQMMPKDQNSRTINSATYLDLAARNTRLHEIGHQWGAYVLPLELLDSTYWHWGMRFDSDLSSLSGSPLDWIPVSSPPGSFQEQYVPPEKSAYCLLDLYLMGMILPTDTRLSQAGSLYYIDNLIPPNTTGTSGDLHTGTRKNLTLQNIITANGPRTPDATNSQRSFRQAFVLLTKDLNLAKDRVNKPYMGALLADIIDIERVAHAKEFRLATESRSVLDTYLYSNAYDGIYVKDNAADTGTEPTSGVFSDSPDIWVRNMKDGGTTHQNPIRGQDNWVYVRVRNNGATASGEVTVNVFRANFTGAEFVYPEDWRLEDGLDKPQVITLGVPPGGAVIVEFKWTKSMIPPASWHSCLLAEVLPIHRTKTGLHHVWENRRLAQKNIVIT